MSLPIVKIGFPALRQSCAEVTVQQLRNPRFGPFLKEMVATMRKANGVGLAANQVGLGLRAIVLECKKSRRYPSAPHFPLQAYVNPRIVSASKKKLLDWEGCLSIPGYRGVVPRHQEIVVEATRPDGTRMRRRIRGWEARVFQHEIDHINGFFYVDRMPDLKTWVHEDEMRKALQARGKPAARRRR